MNYFAWDSDLDVGVDALNEQHKKLIALMETVYQINASDAAKVVVLSALQDLLSFVVKHFEDEEAYMASINFSGLEAHKKIHANLLAEMAQFAKEFAESDETQICEDFMSFLNLWITTHIMAIDTKYSPGFQ